VWGRFTPALNALVTQACELRKEFVIFQSVEVTAEPEAISALLAAISGGGGGGDTAVAGAALRGAHNYKVGQQSLTGLTSPWNTLACWNLDLLSRTGFPPIADGYCAGFSGKDGGVEEVAAIALLQTLFPGKAKAKLVQVPIASVSWTIDFGDDVGRQVWHKAKMESKLARPQKQLAALGKIAAELTVYHV
jgi:hypothetical protein